MLQRSAPCLTVRGGRMIVVRLFDEPHYRWTAGLCANCEAPLEPVPTIALYCSAYCKGWAKDVRYARAARADGRAHLDPRVAEALRTRMAHLVVGGYPDKERRLSPEVRREVLARNGGLCVACNQRQATEVDHIDGSGPEPTNLQGICHPCHRLKTESRFLPMEEEHREVRDAFLAYVEEDEPVMLAHDECWQHEWRRLHRKNLEWALERCVTWETR